MSCAYRSKKTRLKKLLHILITKFALAEVQRSWFLTFFWLWLLQYPDDEMSQIGQTG
jgi:hypothetical protein